jgi:hypothetical protein
LLTLGDENIDGLGVDVEVVLDVLDVEFPIRSYAELNAPVDAEVVEVDVDVVFDIVAEVVVVVSVLLNCFTTLFMTGTVE